VKRENCEADEVILIKKGEFEISKRVIKEEKIETNANDIMSILK
jgi:hypothetical protein